MTSQRELISRMVTLGLEAGAEVRFCADGRSMLPLVRPGDEVVLGAAGQAPPKTGEVVAVQGMPDGGLLLHRVVRLDGERFTLRGDNTKVANGEFEVAELIGVVTRVERRGRSVWFGPGRLGRPVAWAVRNGLVWRVNRAVYGARRRLRRRLKFGRADSRLPEHEGDEGNE